jgi:hypothetical protein
MKNISAEIQTEEGGGGDGLNVQPISQFEEKRLCI